MVDATHGTDSEVSDKWLVGSAFDLQTISSSVGS